MLSCLTETTLQSKSEAEALFKLRKLAGIKDLPAAHLQKLKESASASAILMGGKPLEGLNTILCARGIDPVAIKKPAKPFDDDIPF
jgi:hypothetical protein